MPNHCYLSVEFFTPKPLSDQFDQTRLYLVVTPALPPKEYVPEKSKPNEIPPPPPVEPIKDVPSIDEYFGTAVPDLIWGFLYKPDTERGTPDNAKLTEIFDKIKTANAGGRFNWTPVPLRPGTAVKVLWADSTGSTLQREHTIGAAPFELPVGDWPELLIQNNIGVAKPLREAKDVEPFTGGDPRILPDERSSLLKWATTVFNEIRSRPEGAKNEPYEDLIVAEFDAQKPPPKTEKEFEKFWFDNLNSPPAPAAEPRIIFLHRSRSDAKEAGNSQSPPRFEYDDTTLRKHATEAIPDLGTGPHNSYAEVFWRAFAQKLTNPKAAQSVREALCRYFGQGERLLWKKTADLNADRVMWLDEPEENGFSWTNHNSLLQLVLGIELKSAIDGFRVKQVVITNPAPDGQQPLPQEIFPDVDGKPNPLLLILNESLEHYLEDLILYNSEHFKLRASDLAPAGVTPAYLYYQARVHAASEIHDVPLKNGTVSFAVPEAALDALEEAPAYQMPFQDLGVNPDVDKLMFGRPTEQRITLLDSELATESLNDLSTHGVELYARYPVSVRPFLLSGLETAGAGMARRAVRIRVDASGLQETERTRAIALLKSIPASKAFLWVAQHQNNDPTKPKEVNSHELASPFEILHHEDDLIIAGEPADPLIKALLDPDPEGKLPKMAHLAFPVKFQNNGTTQPPSFNILYRKQTAGDNRVLLGLSAFFDFGFYQSTDRLRLEFNLKHLVEDVQSPTEKPKPKIDFENFTKTWLWISSSELGFADKRLTVRDNLLPQKMVSGHPVVYEFSQELKTPTSGKDKTQDESKQRLNSENFRMLVHRSSGAEWNFIIRADHQYGYRYPATPPLKIRIPTTTPIAHPGKLKIPKAVEKGAGEIEHETLRFLSFSLEENVPEMLSLHFNRAALEELVRAADAKSPITPEAIGNLRNLYEALLDLNPDQDPANGKAAAELVLERWNFDLTRTPTQGKEAALRASDTQLPTFLRNVELVQQWRRPLKASNFQKLLHLVEQDPAHLEDAFELFLQRLRALLKTAGWETEEIGLQPADWKIFPGGAAPKDPIHSTTNLVRVGLILRRGKRRLPSDVPTQFNQMVLHLNHLDDNLVKLPGAIKVDKTAQPSFAGAARESAKKYLTQGLNPIAPDASIRESIVWLESAQYDPAFKFPKDNEKETPEQKKERIRRVLIGAARPQAHVPDAPRKDGDSNPKVRLFTVPLAFRPIAVPGAKENELASLRDPRTTADYVTFLLDLVQTFAEGGVPAEMVEPGSPANAIDAMALIREAHQLRNSAAAQCVSKLLEKVERDPDPADTHWHPHVTSLLETWRKHPASEFNLWKSVEAILLQDLRTFTRAKAIAAHLFDAPSGKEPVPVLFSDRLYSVRITKKIRPPREGKDAGILSPFDPDTFSYTSFIGIGTQRYILDVLDDATYDNEFEIPASRVLGRTEEDILDDCNAYPEGDVDPTSRAIEVTVQHHNPDWTYQPTGEPKKEYYLLPSRTFPATPMPMEPEPRPGPADSLLPWGTEPDEDFLWRENHLASRVFPFTLRAGENPDDVIKAVDANKDTPLDRALKVGHAADRGLFLKHVGTGLTCLTQASRPSSLHVDTNAYLAATNSWHSPDVVLSHYFFAIEPDEEANPDQLTLEGFENDSFRIEVQESEPLVEFPDEKPETVKQDGEIGQGLLGWFRFKRRSQSSGPEVTKPTPMKAPDIISLARNHLERLLMPLQPRAGTGETDPKTTRIVEYSLHNDKGKLNSILAEGSMGQVLDAQIYASFEQSSVASQAATLKRRFVLRVTLLCSAWRDYRVRLRVMRNQRDLQRDGKPDINPVFVMESPSSPWIRHGRVFLKREARTQMPEVLRELPPASGSITLQEWLAASPQDLHEFGDRIKKAVTLQLSAGAKTFALWAEGDGLMLSDKLDVLISLYQYFPDLHPRFPRTKDADRERYLVRALNRTRGDQTDQLLNKVSRDALPTASVVAKVTWLARSPDLNASPGSAIPVLEIDHWRLVWPEEVSL